MYAEGGVFFWSHKNCAVIFFGSPTCRKKYFTATPLAVKEIVSGPFPKNAHVYRQQKKAFLGGSVRVVVVQRARRSTICRPLLRKRDKSTDLALLIKKKCDGAKTCSGNCKTLYAAWMKKCILKRNLPPNSNNEPTMKCALFLVRPSRGISHALFSVVEWLTLKRKSRLERLKQKVRATLGEHSVKHSCPIFCHDLKNVLTIQVFLSVVLAQKSTSLSTTLFSEKFRPRPQAFFFGLKLHVRCRAKQDFQTRWKTINHQGFAGKQRFELRFISMIWRFQKKALEVSKVSKQPKFWKSYFAAAAARDKKASAVPLERCHTGTATN